jgi:HEAT repeat protein
LPEQFLEIAKRESNPNVRVEIIKTLGSWQVPDLFTLLENDLQHRQAEVRNAAMLALADARHQEAIPMMRDRLRDAIGANRAAAASALRKLGVFEEVLKLVEDTDPQVRVEVARTFSERCTPQIAGFARSYIADRNQKVQLETIEAINGWSIEEAGPLLLMAAKSFHLEVRYRATEMLAQRGISSPDFNPEARPENQTEQYQELVQIFRESVGMEPMLDGNTNERSAENRSAIRQVSAITPDDATLAEVRRCLDDWSDRTQSPEQRHLIHRRLTAHGHRLMPMIDHLVITEKRTIPSSLDQVFAEIEPMFREIERLKSNDLSTRRRAAIELDRLGSVASPPQLAAKRMIDLAAREDDSIVLRSLLNALKNADPDSVCQLARPLLQSESAEVRRLSCEMLKQFGSSEDVPLLHDMLHDSSRAVVREALLAIDALLERDDAIDSSVLGTLKSMLISSDPMLQIDIAATLHRLGHSEGTDALRRLAVSNDHHIRTQIARTVSNLNDRAFVSLLLRYLEDSNATVRSEALKGLPKLAGQDIGRSGPFQSSDTSPTQQQIDRWKSWGKEWRE